MKKKVFYAIIAIAIIFAAVVAVVILKSQNTSNTTFTSTPVSAFELQQLRAVANNNTLAESVLVGSASNFPTQLAATPLIINGSPAVFYAGADYCPYCAVTRWGLILALMRFGNFTNLHYMISSGTDVDPNTPTFTFYNSSYTSPYLAFLGVEYQTRSGALLQNFTPLETNIMDHFNGPPKGGFPFIDFGNISMQSGAEASPLLLANSNWTQITAMLNDPHSPVSQAIIGSADVFTAQMCMMTNNTPASVCKQQYAENTEKFLSG